jgi:tRNA (mo5U34)-methyltransferase
MNDSQVAQIRQEVIDLAPWHIEIEIAHGVMSTVGNNSSGSTESAPQKIAMINPKEGFVRTLRTIYPNGLEFRSFLDCGCNCGAYCFWARELGAGRMMGIDARGHWIQQARLIQKYRQIPLLEFHEMELNELATKPLPRFDITLLKGLLHLVPDPIRALKIAADLTRELMILNSPVVNIVDPEPVNGCFYFSPNPGESLIDGIHKLNWYPSGPKVLLKMLEWLGFPYIKLHYYVKSAPIATESAPLRGQKKGVVEIIAARQTGLLGRLSTIERGDPQIE